MTCDPLQWGHFIIRSSSFSLSFDFMKVYTNVSTIIRRSAMEPETEEGVENGGDTNNEVDYWKRKCTSLQKQVEKLTAANRFLGRQIHEKNIEIRKLSNVRTEGGCEEIQKCGQSAMSLFPEELWTTLFEYLVDPQDLLNICRTSNELDTVLHPSKVTWMMKLVIGHLFKSLNKEDLLNCRLVCKKWNAAVDNFIESHPSKLPFTEKTCIPHDDDALSIKKLNSSTVFHLWDVDRIPVFLVEIREHLRNPFVGRSVVFNVEIDDDFDDDDDEDFEDPGIEEFWKLSRVLLNLAGRHIWYIEITEDSGRQKPMEFYKLLRELLIYLPNLRSLKLAVDISHEDYYPKALPLCMANNPLPALPHLESLDVGCFYPEVPQIIHDMLIAMYSSQLLKLHLNLDRWKDIYNRGLENLRELHVSGSSLTRLDLLQAPKLGKICVDFKEVSSLPSSASLKFSSAGYLLQTLSRFRNLRVLKLIVDIMVEFEDIVSSNRKLCKIPSLEQLEVHGIQRKISYSFLKFFPSLKYISIHESTSVHKFNEDPAVVAFLEGDSYFREEIVEVHRYMYSGRMYESNIWHKIPSLKNFSFERIRYGNLIFKHMYNRETYNYRKLPHSIADRKNNL